MGILYAPGVAQKIRDQIKTFGINPRNRLGVAIFESIEALYEDPFLGERDNDGILGGTYVYNFAVTFPPIVARVYIAYDRKIHDDGTSDLEILDLVINPK